MKTCASCNEALPLSSFCIRRDTKDGLNASCRACMSARNKKWRESNPEKVRESERRAAEYRQEYKQRDHVKARRRELSQLPEKKAARNARVRNQRAADPAFAIHNRMSCAVNASLRRAEIVKGWRSWQSIVGYSTEELRAHLEKQFLNGMGWHNMDEWQVDHIVPRADFKFSSIEDQDFLACWSLGNLRPIWSKDNLRKGDRKEFLI